MGDAKKFIVLQLNEVNNKKEKQMRWLTLLKFISLEIVTPASITDG